MKTQRLHTVLSMMMIIIAMVWGSAAQAQVKVGSNPLNLNPDAVFEVESSNKGFLFPRVSLTSTVSAAPLSRFVSGMVVYNTNTVNDVAPGIYYCDGFKWLKITAGGVSESPTANWSLNGNNNTNSNHFLGTTDNAALRFRTNNLERMRITGNGWVGIGTSAPNAALEVKGQVIIDSLLDGNTATDNILVADANGRVKKVSTSGILSGVQKKLEVVAASGQTIFTTPATITDISRIMMYRNGVMISFTMNNANSIIAEIPCMSGDEIRIIQLL